MSATLTLLRPHAQRVDSIDDVDETTWSSLAGDNALLRPAFLRAMESSGAEGQPQYYLGFDSYRPVGIAVGWRRSIKLEGCAPPIMRRVVDQARRVTPNLLRMSMLDFGPSASDGTAIAAGPDPRDEKLWLKLLLDEANSHADAIIVRDFVGPHRRQESLLKQAGFAMLPSPPTVAMDVRWDDFDDFVADLRTRYRTTLLTSRRRVTRSGVRCVVSKTPSAPLEDFDRLFRNVERKQHADCLAGPRYFQAMAQHANEDNVWFQYFLDSKLVAFVHCIRAGDELWSMFIGMDYQACVPLRLYFQTFYDQIRYAIDTGVRYIHFGCGAYTAKTDVGCSVFPMRAYFRHRSTWQQSLMVRARRMVWKQPKRQPRRAFRSPVNQYHWPGDDPYMTNMGDYIFGGPGGLPYHW